MKKLFIGLLALGSISAFAKFENCDFNAIRDINRSSDWYDYSVTLKESLVIPTGITEVIAKDKSFTVYMRSAADFPRKLVGGKTYPRIVFVNVGEYDHFKMSFYDIDCSDRNAPCEAIYAKDTQISQIVTLLTYEEAKLSDSFTLTCSPKKIIEI